MSTHRAGANRQNATESALSDATAPARGIARLWAVHTGDELLDGRIPDTNAAWLGGELRARGVRLAGITVVGDSQDAIRDAVLHAAREADFVLVGGGLGPTSDDRTRDAIAEAAERPLVESAALRAELEAFFAARNLAMPSANLGQCQLPRDAIVRPNPRGTATAFESRVAGCPVLVVPGVPHEYRGCVRDHLLPRLGSDAGERRLWPLLGLPESEAAERLAGVERMPGLRVSYRAAMPWLHVGLSGAAEVVREGQAELERVLGDWAVGDGSLDAPSWVLASARRRGLRLATAESCTGGRIAAALTSVAGSSDVMERGWVTYSNASKTDELGVPAPLIAEHGAVSPRVATAMARGARERARVDWAVSVTGVAGPGGGTDAKPVGTVWLGAAGPDGEAWRALLRVGARRRETVRAFAEAAALVLLGRCMEGRAETLRALRFVELLEATDAGA